MPTKHKVMALAFQNTQMIYVQIADYIQEQILQKKLVEGQKLPSVRQLAIQLGVNPNTVMRTYQLLAHQQIIVQRRGIGSFMTQDALERVIDSRRERFLTNELPNFFHHLYTLGISFNQIKQYPLNG